MRRRAESHRRDGQEKRDWIGGQLRRRTKSHRRGKIGKTNWTGGKMRRIPSL